MTGKTTTTRHRRTETTVSTTWAVADVLKALGLPPDTRLFVKVPGGGDWSNSMLDIGEDADLQSVSVTQDEEDVVDPKQGDGR